MNGTPRGRRRARDRELAVRVRDREHADRREEERRRRAACRAPRRRCRARALPREHPRPQPPPLERLEVRAHRRLGAGAARDVAERPGVEHLRAPRASQSAGGDRPAAARRRCRSRSGPRCRRNSLRARIVISSREVRWRSSRSRTSRGASAASSRSTTSRSTLEQGEIAGLIGPNGAGKTTLFNVITRLYTPDDGRVVFDGAGPAAHAAAPDRRLGIARTFQNVALFHDDDRARERARRRAHRGSRPFAERQATRRRRSRRSTTSARRARRAVWPPGSRSGRSSGSSSRARSSRSRGCSCSTSRPAA